MKCEKEGCDKFARFEAFGALKGEPNICTNEMVHLCADCAESFLDYVEDYIKLEKNR